MRNHTAYVGLGSNKGDRFTHLRRSVEALSAYEEIRVSRVSSVYETEAHTRGPQDSRASFLNAVVELNIALAPEELLDVLQETERAAGRQQKPGAEWEARPLDLDILVYDALSCQTDRLTLPHPRLGERRFVLIPLVEINPQCWIPAPFDTTAQKLLAQCSDPYTVEKTELRLSRPG